MKTISEKYSEDQQSIYRKLRVELLESISKAVDKRKQGQALKERELGEEAHQLHLENRWSSPRRRALHLVLCYLRGTPYDKCEHSLVSLREREVLSRGLARVITPGNTPTAQKINAALTLQWIKGTLTSFEKAKNTALSEQMKRVAQLQNYLVEAKAELTRLKAINAEDGVRAVTEDGR